LFNENVLHAVLGVGSGNETPVELPKKLMVPQVPIESNFLMDGIWLMKNKESQLTEQDFH